MLRKIIAKKVIISAPFTMTAVGQFLLQKFKISVNDMDVFVQNWALSQSDFFSDSDWHDVQFMKLKKILCHAGKNVLYWKVLFKKIKFNPDEMSDIHDIKKIPIITREELKKIPLEELSAQNICKTRFVKAATSGSTGEPFHLYQDERDLFRRRINTEQELRYIGVKKGDTILRIGLKKHKDLDDFGSYISAHGLENEQTRLNNIYPLILSSRPKVLISTPSYLRRFLFLCEKDNFHVEIEKICYMGEQMDSETKSKLESFFGAMVYTTYGTRECSLIGVQCKNRSLHLAPWMNFVEIVDGQVVVTTFENEAMPFIRYAIGDEGRQIEEFCKCGKQSKVIEFDGRALFGAIEFPDGSVFQVSYIVQHLAEEYYGKISKFQFEQVSLRELSMHYIPTLEEDSERLEERLGAYFRSIFPDTLRVIFNRVETISPNESGKTPLFIKKINEYLAV